MGHHLVSNFGCLVSPMVHGEIKVLKLRELSLVCHGCDWLKPTSHHPHLFESLPQLSSHAHLFPNYIPIFGYLNGRFDPDLYPCVK